MNDAERQLSGWLEGAQPLTDVGNGRRFDAQHGAIARYCYARRAWMIYDAGRWTRDEGDRAMVMAKATAARLDIELAQLTEATARKELRKWADYSESATGLGRMLEMAQSERPIVVEAFDADPDTLNTPSGTVHLPSSELRAPRATDYLSKMTAARYDPAARHPVLDRFLAMALPDPKTRAYVQRAAGYSITGHATEEVMLNMHGGTGAGKTTFLECARAALGDYATAADFDTLAPHKHPGGPREDLARLLDARWV
jgi:putative DNA primase/helicase